MEDPDVEGNISLVGAPPSGGIKCYERAPFDMV